VSPRSEELLAKARECLEVARGVIELGHPSRSVHDSYYRMVYAARAALSERDLYAKTHAGTWHLFGEEFVKCGQFDAELAGRGPAIEKLQEGTDYDAAPVTEDQARATLADAERFVGAVFDLLGTE
jgi:uncharacterized protein (UPF0332 family)